MTDDCIIKVLEWVVDFTNIHTYQEAFSDNGVVYLWLERLEGKLYLPLNRFEVAILYMNRSNAVYNGALEGCFGIKTRLVRSLGLGEAFPDISAHSKFGEEAILYANPARPALVLRGWVEKLSQTGGASIEHRVLEYNWMRQARHDFTCHPY